MADFITLYSGSSGNSTLITDGTASVLIDMGRSCRHTISALYEVGKAATDIAAILLTHEHTDHVSGLQTFLKHYSVPVYGPAATLEYLRTRALVPEAAQLIPTDGLGTFAVEDIKIRSFRTSHDSLDCAGYRLELSSGKSVAVATDLGYVSDDVYEAICGCDLVGLESNYDENMLALGGYPYYLKSRIRSRTGHLCNVECSSAASLLAQTGTSRMVLMHLSQENNEPELALTTCLSVLENHGISERDIQVSVAPRHRVGEPLEV